MGAILHGLNTLRVVLIVGVMLHHTLLAFIPGESWPVTSPEKSELLKPILGVNASFAMGLFFFISGFFFSKSLRRKGAGGVVKANTLRLGGPLLLICFVVLPLTFALAGKPWSFQFGHGWFLVNLLCFQLLLAGLLSVPRVRESIGRLPWWGFFAGYLLGNSVYSILAHRWLPQNSWLFFHALEPYHLFQYTFLFVGGACTERADWMSIDSFRRVITPCLALGCVMAVAYLVVFTRKGPLAPIPYDVWQSVLSLVMTIGLFGTFHRVTSPPGRVGTFLAQHTLLCYVYHVPLVLMAQDYFIGTRLGLGAKVSLSCLVGVGLSFGCAALIRQGWRLVCRVAARAFSARDSAEPV